MATNEPGLPESTNTEEQNRSYIASGGQDGDRVEKPGTSIPGKQQTPESNPKSPIEDRMRNPLGDFSSYTYQLTLYMVSPTAYNAYVETGRKNINAIGSAQTISNRSINSNQGIFIIAQSGGINKTQNRAPYLDLDYYIDDLKIKSNISGSSTQGATNVSEVSFKIVEPYGFSFLTELKLASETLVKTSTGTAGYKGLKNALKQFFILGIRFIGYDDKGNIVDTSTPLSGTQVSKNNIGGVRETFYDIAVVKLDFKLEGKATTYELKGQIQTSLIGFNIKFGRIDKNAELEAETVGTALTKLADILNTIQSNTKTTYKFVFVGDGIKNLEDAKFYSDADLNKLTSGMSIAKTTAQVTDAVGVGEVPKLNIKQFKINNSTSVLQQVDNIIAQSEYLIKALSTVYKSNLQAQQSINSQRQDNKNENTEVQWYHISADVRVGDFIKELNDYNYEITYVIEPYKTPAITSAYIPKTTKYYGPHKRYNYYFTGQNTEIISYSQTYNNAFFNIINDVDLTPENYESATQEGQVSITPNKRQDQERLGKLDTGFETSNAFRTSLYDPKAYAKAKISILGDPDFLIQETTSSVRKVYNQFYGAGSTISANGGQVFIEVNFNEARDYDAVTKTGLLTVNDRILFWKYPADIADRIQGVVYQVAIVTSTFSRGKFTQELDCVMPTFRSGSNSIEDQRKIQIDENQSSNEANKLLRYSATSSTAQVKVPPVNPANPAPTKTNTVGSSQRTVRGVADDDSVNVRGT